MGILEMSGALILRKAKMRLRKPVFKTEAVTFAQVQEIRESRKIVLGLQGAGKTALFACSRVRNNRILFRRMVLIAFCDTLESYLLEYPKPLFKRGSCNCFFSFIRIKAAKVSKAPIRLRALAIANSTLLGSKSRESPKHRKSRYSESQWK
jgi:hypothetical protein